MTAIALANHSAFSGITTPTVSLASTNVSHVIDITCYANCGYHTNGVEYSNSNGSNNYTVSRGNWKDSGDAEGAWIDHTLNSGSALFARAQVPGTRAQCGVANRNYSQRDTNSSAGSVTSNITVTMYDAQTGGSSLGSATYSLTANYFNACPLCCFVPGTMITMSDGSQRPIEFIQPGDEVVVYDPVTGSFSYDVVGELLTRVARRMYKIYFENGTVLHASDDHPLYVRGKGAASIVPQEAYKHQYKTKSLEVGDFVTCIKASWWEGHDVEKITKIEYSEYLEVVYTLDVSYFFANNKLVL